MQKKIEHFLNKENLQKALDNLPNKTIPIEPNWKEDMLLAIGKFIVRYQRMENTIKSFIAFLLHVQASNQRNIEHIVTAKLGFAASVDMLYNLARERNIPHLTELEKFTSLANEVAEIRNYIVHSVFFMDGNYKISSSKTGVLHSFNDSDSLLALGDKIHDINIGFNSLMWIYLEDINTRSNKIKLAADSY